jgi:hypothetical protein
MNTIQQKFQSNTVMKFVKETEQYAANFRKSAASCVREETSEREKSYKGYMCVYVTENYKNVHVVTTTMFHRSNTMNNFLFLIIYLQLYK